jgi:hypothetical protein
MRIALKNSGRPKHESRRLVLYHLVRGSRNDSRAERHNLLPKPHAKCFGSGRSHNARAKRHAGCTEAYHSKIAQPAACLPPWHHRRRIAPIAVRWAPKVGDQDTQPATLAFNIDPGPRLSGQPFFRRTVFGSNTSASPSSSGVLRHRNGRILTPT